MHDPQPNPIQPAPSADKRVRRISQRVEEDKRPLLKPNGLDFNLVPDRQKRPGYGPILPLDSGVGELQDLRIGAIKKTVGRPCIQTRCQFPRCGPRS